MSEPIDSIDVKNIKCKSLVVGDPEGDSPYISMQAFEDMVGFWMCQKGCHRDVNITLGNRGCCIGIRDNDTETKLGKGIVDFAIFADMDSKPCVQVTDAEGNTYHLDADDIAKLGKKLDK